MIIYTNTKSPKKLNKNKTKKVLEEYNDWIKSINSIKTPSGSIIKKSLVTTKRPNLSFVPVGRETKCFPSHGSNGGTATKPVDTLHYTGSKMKGIGTLHKSNAVPVFTDEEARDQANMRR
jgi:hypothetical protein